MFSLVHAIVGFSGFLLDGHVFPAPSLAFLMRLLPPPLLLRYIHCCGVAEAICTVTQYFLPLQFEPEVLQFVQMMRECGMFRLT